MLHRTYNLDTLERPRQRKTDTRFGTWIVKCLYRAGSLKAAASVLAKYKLHLMAIKEIRLNKGGSEPVSHVAGDYIFLMEIGMLNITWEQATSYVMGSDEQLRG
jgi:hypothetical protein